MFTFWLFKLTVWITFWVMSRELYIHVVGEMSVTVAGSSYCQFAWLSIPSAKCIKWLSLRYAWEPSNPGIIFRVCWSNFRLSWVLQVYSLPITFEVFTEYELLTVQKWGYYSMYRFLTIYTHKHTRIWLTEIKMASWMPRNSWPLVWVFSGLVSCYILNTCFQVRNTFIIIVIHTT